MAPKILKRASECLMKPIHIAVEIIVIVVFMFVLTVQFGPVKSTICMIVPPLLKGRCRTATHNCGGILQAKSEVAVRIF